ncbi:hypothetical protein G7K_1257-t1 [Saitoella complicata NRRL Y-17804]|uniref:Uncharacterized protein n=1 Tax=Saitoella complicata (strain BCRC 22490 / CBS 7301 / JCM 7358 / NBRC 10748 / NRRL Y-17804) TaxID=698492 RepID=A0A0E9NB31_SAICN|nr:hypothetical protein G7K_1257-t1 [Saitoella complicata NRRL Y-17804]
MSCGYRSIDVNLSTSCHAVALCPFTGYCAVNGGTAPDTRVYSAFYSYSISKVFIPTQHKTRPPFYKQHPPLIPQLQ